MGNGCSRPCAKVFKPAVHVGQAKVTQALYKELLLTFWQALQCLTCCS